MVNESTVPIWGVWTEGPVVLYNLSSRFSVHMNDFVQKLKGSLEKNEFLGNVSMLFSLDQKCSLMSASSPRAPRGKNKNTEGEVSNRSRRTLLPLEYVDVNLSPGLCRWPVDPLCRCVLRHWYGLYLRLGRICASGVYEHGITAYTWEL